MKALKVLTYAICTLLVCWYYFSLQGPVGTKLFSGPYAIENTQITSILIVLIVLGNLYYAMPKLLGYKVDVVPILWSIGSACVIAILIWLTKILQIFGETHDIGLLKFNITLILAAIVYTIGLIKNLDDLAMISLALLLFFFLIIFGIAYYAILIATAVFCLYLLFTPNVASE